jgi:hypothetical protein
MRVLIKAKIPTEAGNKMVQDPDFMKKLENYINKVKPEAAYFLANDGHRTATFVVDMQSSGQVPALVEPLFQWMGANVDVTPVMNYDDLKKGLSENR